MTRPARQQQRIEELCGASARALAGDPLLHFRGRRLCRGADVLPPPAAHLSPSPDHDDFDAFRGAADGLALRLVRSDAGLHAALAPDDAIARRLFDLIEQYRVESLAPVAMSGLAGNLRRRHARWSDAFHQGALGETEQGLLIYTVAQVVRARVTGEPMDARTEDLVEATRMALAPRIGVHLARLRAVRHDQAAYAEHARGIAHQVARMLREAEQDRARGGSDEARQRQRQRLSLWLDGDADADADGSVPAAGLGRSRVLEASSQGYRVFTTAYDQTVPAATLVRAELLATLREALDRRIAASGVSVQRLARELQALLAVPAHDGWDGAQEQGRIDGRRLAQLVASPTERRLFRHERVQPRADCLVSFLIDCSGSMKQHGERVSLLVDMLVRALEQAGVATEVLGFTTGAWNGGRARRDWMRAGRPEHPGRLNERCHLVFKDAESTWRQSRASIAALLKADLFREGIDGEAVDWACTRLRARSERRRLLVAVSDGSPMDTATALANDPHYLDAHLQQTVARHERPGDIELCAVGVGLDLSPYYRRSRILDVSAAPGHAVFADVMRLLAPRGAARAP